MPAQVRAATASSSIDRPQAVHQGPEPTRPGACSTIEHDPCHADWPPDTACPATKGSRPLPSRHALRLRPSAWIEPATPGCRPVRANCRRRGRDLSGAGGGTEPATSRAVATRGAAAGCGVAGVGPAATRLCPNMAPRRRVHRRIGTLTRLPDGLVFQRDANMGHLALAHVDRLEYDVLSITRGVEVILTVQHAHREASVTADFQPRLSAPPA